MDLATVATVAQGGTGFGTFMAAVKDATSVLGCQRVQQQPDCSVLVNPQPQQDLPLTVTVNPPSLNPPSLQAVSPVQSLHQDGSRSGTPTHRTPTTLRTPTPQDEGKGGKQ